MSLEWEVGEPTERLLDRSDDDLAAQYPRARYLSQKFVEELCSAHGMTDALMQEIERVIFESHALSDRDGAVSFQELLEMRVARHHEARLLGEETLAQLSERISIELDKDRSLRDLKAQVSEKERLVAAYTNDRSKLISKGSEARVERTRSAHCSCGEGPRLFAILQCTGKISAGASGRGSKFSRSSCTRNTKAVARETSS